MSTEDTDESNEFLPALRDWPKGYGEASWWPFFTTLGLTAIYLGAIVYTVGNPGNVASPTIGEWIFGVGIIGTSVGMLGWTYQAFVVDYWNRSSNDGGESLRIGMLLAIASDLGTFGALFAYYFFIRVGAWKTSYLPKSGLLSNVLVINTVALVGSSLVLRWAEDQLKKGNHQQFVQGVIITFLLGVVFIAGQIYEYYGFIVHDGFTITTGIFASGFFGLTGLHGLHVAFGVILLLFLAIRGLNNQFNRDHYISVTTISWYWYFIAASWLFFVAVVYISSVLGTQFSPF